MYLVLYMYVSCFIGKSIFSIFILFPGLPSQSSFVQGHFKCSFKKYAKFILKITTVVDLLNMRF